MKKKAILFLFILGLIFISGCGSDEGNETISLPKDVMTRVQINNGADILEQIDYKYTEKGFRTGKTVILKSAVGSTVKEITYNNYSNISDLKITEKDSTGVTTSIIDYSFIYDYTKALLTIKKDSKIKYEIAFWSTEDIKSIKEEKYEILFNYLQTAYDGYAMEYNYLYNQQELCCNIKNMVKSALIYDDTQNKDYKIEYAARNKILKETKKDKRYEYVYETATKIIKKEYDNFDGITSENIYIVDKDTKGSVQALLLNSAYIWKRDIFYNDTNQLRQETFIPNIAYIKTNYGSYKKSYNYDLNKKLENITLDYSSDIEGKEKGIYILNTNNQIIQYSISNITRKYTYNSDDTLYKYEVFSPNVNINSNTIMVDTSDL